MFLMFYIKGDVQGVLEEGFFSTQTEKKIIQTIYLNIRLTPLIYI